MEILKKSIKCDSRLEYYKLHLELINPLVPNQLTEKEIMVLAAFMSIDKKLVEDDRFNSLVRKKVREKYKISQGGLSNYLKAMLTKGFLSKSDITGRIKIKDFVMPGESKQGYMFRIGYAVKGVHKAKGLRPQNITREEIESDPKEVAAAYNEAKAPIDDAIPTQKEINAAMAQAQADMHKFDNEEEDEDEVPYKMKD